MKKSFVWFDLGYTLFRLDREDVYQSILKKNDIDMPIEEIEKGFHIVDKIFMRDYPGVLARNPRTYMPWYFGLLNHYLGISLNLCSIYQEWEEAHIGLGLKRWIPYDFVYNTLEELKRRKVKLGVISNWDNTAKKLLETNGLLSYFDNVIISSEVGYEKPTEEIFRIALNEAKVDSEECLYVGDNYYDDAVGSKKVNMDCLIINRFGKLGIEEIDAPIIKDVSELVNYFNDVLLDTQNLDLGLAGCQ